ncbi:maleylacetoacetate isomerase [Shewanella sp. Scap07]|uniref:maleylacetoacetate isomerase n=1 Tax=Shewanella sp. Scap07 TaxID=2589987 RepID=UPI0015C020EF|nr:maleylacetoacetate isomerase [Shewanella sp. Scap07]QLE87840.1 maleylacetoacetate isomerase [Shewanella sp. Scap07]
MKLYGYWRSSAAYRVRIALNLKQLEAELISVHLVKGGGQQHAADYAKLNPQELVPTLVTDDASGDEFVLTQSMAIIDYLDERYPQSSLLPDNLELKAQVRAMAYTIACDVHPLNNLKVLQYLANTLNVADDPKSQWYHHWIHQGFTAIERQLQQHAGQYCFGEVVTLADVVLVPQIYNAKRFNVDLSSYPLIEQVWQHCNQLEAFKQALPENQADAVIS